MTNSQKATQAALNYIDASDRAERRLDHARRWPVNYRAEDMAKLVADHIRASRAAKVAMRASLWYETGGLMYNARDFR